MEREEVTDADLVKQVARGDESALRELFDRHAAWLRLRLLRRAAATSADFDEEFLRKIRERAEEQRRAYREERLRIEREERGEAGPTG